jgi:hypothetical protein
MLTISVMFTGEFKPFSSEIVGPATFSVGFRVLKVAAQSGELHHRHDEL